MGGGYGPAAGGSWPDFLEPGWNAAAPDGLGLGLGPAPGLDMDADMDIEKMDTDMEAEAEAHLTPHSPYAHSSIPATGDCERGMDGKAEESRRRVCGCGCGA